VIECLACDQKYEKLTRCNYCCSDGLCEDCAEACAIEDEIEEGETVSAKENKMATYNELFEQMYHPQSEMTVAAIEPSDRTAWMVLKVLGKRKGFDDWWDSIEGEIQDEIFESIKSIINSTEK
jgi:hypothetical protein